MTPRFPTWILLGAVVLACGYLPTLRTPFDFIDDGNLVYPAHTGTSLSGHVALWWEKVVANYEHLGPFRPVVWAHWELFANVCVDIRRRRNRIQGPLQLGDRGVGIFQRLAFRSVNCGGNFSP